MPTAFGLGCFRGKGAGAKAKGGLAMILRLLVRPYTPTSEQASCIATTKMLLGGALASNWNCPMQMCKAAVDLLNYLGGCGPDHEVQQGGN